MRAYKIAVAGAGYVGMAMAVLLSQHHQVTVVDIVPEKISMINRRQSPVRDDVMQQVLSHTPLQLSATLDAQAAYADADFVVIAVPTNYDDVTQRFQTAAVEEVIGQVTQCNPDAAVVIKSTVRSGTRRQCARNSITGTSSSARSSCANRTQWRTACTQAASLSARTCRIRT